ncbi:MAG TPA: DUF3465 domain-containing protein [Armatimonadota bacterium]|nr:DUF3465 domain-containing protein [Armatimonadota bacterium]
MKRRTWTWTCLGLALAVAGLWALCARRPDGARAAERAFALRTSGIVLTVPGVVARILDDDTRSPRHQRFILRTARGQTLLVSHNLELAPRAPVRAGDAVTVRGQYEWNNEGGLLHNTHSRPRRPSGWIRLSRVGRTYH